MKAAHFILYVADQDAATRFYTAALGREPRLHVPGMTDHVAYSLDPDGHVIAFARSADG